MQKLRNKIGIGRKRKAIRWTLEVAASEFNINPRTLAKRCKAISVEFGMDRKMSTSQVCSAVFGDIDSERLRLTKEQADEKALSNAEQRRELVKFSEVLEVAHRGLSAMTSTVMGLTHLTVEDREAIINQLRAAGEVVEHGDGSRESSAALHG